MSYVPGERWDRDRFERASRRGAPVMERYDEHDYISRPGFREERDIHEEDVYRRGSGRDRERVFFEEREQYGAPVPYRPRRESVKYFDERETIIDRSGDMVPYRPREREEERDVEIKYTRESRPARTSRPQFVRRQSSLDTYDRRPMPRYGDRIREEVVIPAPPRRRTPPRYVEREYEEIKVAEPDYYGDEEYRPYREREVETIRTRNAAPPPPPPVEQEIIYEREEIVQEEFPKRGKTRMPRRLINTRAIIELGYPYEEEGETIIIQKALGKEHIDEVIRISRDFNMAPPPAIVQENKITYAIEAPPPRPPTVQMMPPPLDQPVPPVIEEEIIKRRTEIIRENPSLRSASESSSSRSSSPSASTVTAVSRKSHKTSKSHKSHASHHSHHTHKSSRTSRSRARSRDTVRSKSTRRHRSLSSASTARELVIREREPVHETALIIPNRRRKSRANSISAEIRALEAEKEALKYERKAEIARRGGAELIVEKEYRDGLVEIKKDRRAPNPKILKGMLATLT